ARMPYLQPVRGKYRVRIEVPPELRPKIGKANLTKALGTGNEREATRLALPHIAEFMRIIERARGLDELIVIDGLPFLEQLQRAPEALHRFLSTLSLPVPATEMPREPVTFEEMIALWGKTKGKKTLHAMEATCGRFGEFLGH